MAERRQGQGPSSTPTKALAGLSRCIALAVNGEKKGSVAALFLLPLAGRRTRRGCRRRRMASLDEEAPRLRRIEARRNCGHLSAMPESPAPRRDHSRHALRAELLAGVVHPDHARGAGRSGRRSRQAQGGRSSKAGVTLEKILLTHGHADHCGQAGMLAKELVPADRGAARGRPVLDRPARGRRAAVRDRDQSVRARRAGSVDGDTRVVRRGRARGAPLPGHTPGHVVFFHRADALRLRRRRAVPGLDRAHRLPDGQPPGPARRDHRQALAARATR